MASSSATLRVTRIAFATLCAVSSAAAMAAATSLSGEYDTINTPDGFTIGNDVTVVSNDGKFVTGGSMQDVNAGATLILASENASIETGGRFFVGSNAVIKQAEDEDLLNLSFNGGAMTLSGSTLNVTGTMNYFSAGGVASGSYIELIQNGVLNVDHLVSTSYYTLNVSHNGSGGTATIRLLDAPGLVSVEQNGVLNIAERATVGHLWNMGGTINAENAVVEIKTEDGMYPMNYDGSVYKYADGETYTFGNGIDKSQKEEDKAAATANIGTLIVHGNALNAEGSTLTAKTIEVDGILNNDAQAKVAVADGSISARTIHGAEGQFSLENASVTVQETSDFGAVTANQSTFNLTGDGDYAFSSLKGSDHSILVSDLAASISIGEKEGALTLTAEGAANDNYGNAQESVARIQDMLTIDSGSQAGDVYVLEQGAVNDGARIEFNDQGQPQITYTRNSNMESFGNIAALSIVNWRSELDSLTKRMGELRDSPAGVGAWVRLYGAENELGSVTAHNTTVQIGSDVAVGDWKIGAALNYTDGSAAIDNGDADNKAYGAAIYGTWMSENGQFVDLVAKYSRLDQDFSFGDFDGSYDNNAYALSVEYGWRFNLSTVAFVEPQAAFTYAHIDGDSFRAAANVKMDQDDFDSYIGRIGVRGGFKFPDNRGVIYARVSYLYDFDGEMNATARATAGNGVNSVFEDLGGSWVEYGIGANFNLTESTYSYVDLERTSGGEVRENWRWNIGLRHVF